MISEMTWSNGQAVVDVATGLDVSTIAVRRAGAVDTGVLDARLWTDSSAEYPHDCPHRALGAEGRRPVTEGHGGIQIREFSPPDRKIYGLGGIHLEPTVPAAEVQLEHEQPLARVQLSALFDETDNGFGCGKEEFPDVAAMGMRGNEGVNPIAHLRAIGNSTPNRNFGDGTQGTVEDLKGEFTRLERTDESPVLQLDSDVGVNVLRSDF